MELKLMSEYQVQSIEDDAKQTKKSLQGKQRDKKITITLDIDSMISYCDKVLFLCKTIRKLNHK